MKQNELKGLDKKVKNIYDYGCYFLDLLYVSKYKEPTLEEIIKYYDTFTAKGWMDEECFVKNPCDILNFLTGKRYSVVRDPVLDTSASHIIGYFYNPNTSLHHFVVMGKDDKVCWDSIENSNTVKNGFVESYRMFKEIHSKT